jgi:hypothetical protein
MIKGKGLCEPCLICGEDRCTDQAHFPTPKKSPFFGTDTIPLCPTHHKLLDKGRLSDWEFMQIYGKRYADRGFVSVRAFLTWAHRDNPYPYSYEMLQKKKIRSEYEQPKLVYYYIENEKQKDVVTPSIVQPKIH